MSFVHQNILPNNRYPRTIIFRRVLPDDAVCGLTQRSTVSANGDTIFIGISYHITETGTLDFICLASLTHAFIISDGSRMRNGSKSFATLLQSEYITNHNISGDVAIEVCLVGFGMAQIAIQVRQATGLQIKGVDLSSLSNTREPLPPSKFIAERVDAKVDKFAVARLWMGDQNSVEKDVVLQAWLAACAAGQCESQVKTARKVDTQHLNSFEQACLSRLIVQSDLLEWKKPKEVPNDFSQGGMNKQGKYEIHNLRYKTRIRRSEQCQVILTDMKGNEFVGSARHIKGKRTTIAFQDQRYPGEGLRQVKVVGRQDPTNSEKAQQEFILLIMMGIKTLRDSSFIRMLWFPNWKSINVEPAIVSSQDADIIVDKIGLNISQRAAVHAMVGALPLIVVHGPPGTGKTTTIAAASRIWDLFSLPVWIVAHSNVAVKNIAETLYKKKVDFKLLVSKEFYEEWHEYLYDEIAARLIRSDELPTQKVDMERVVASSRIILCTLSMLSNPALYENGTFGIVPFTRLVIDEASQINAFEFMHIFERFQTRLEKVCFFGDPNQLPPYGHEDVPEMKTIFEFDHLKKADVVHFLNTQYRMPNPIATFISLFVYNNRLLSDHLISSPDCLAFIDASRTGEERAGFSSRNLGEIDTIVHLVKNYYRRKNFCVITPYDAQRAAIQKRLEDEDLPWEAVYNVDSFQGNEADYVIVSVVRSSHKGFLRSRPRMNVLLTRCRQGLIIVSNRLFLGNRGSGSDTLLGQLVTYWQVRYPQRAWISWSSVAEASVDLPGVAGKGAVLKTHPTTVYSVMMTPHTSLTQNFISPSSRQLGTPSDKTTYADVASFPPLVPKQPLLKGSWCPSVFQSIHPLSLVHRRGQLPDATTKENVRNIPPFPTSPKWPSVSVSSTKRKESLPPPLVTNDFRSADLRASNQRPFIQKATRAKTKESQNMKSSSTKGPKQQPSTLSFQSTGFIRSITVHSRHP